MEGLRYVYLRRVIAPILRALGPRVSERMARRLARGVAELGTPARQVAQRRIAACIEATDGDERPGRIALAMYDHVARFWIEALFIRRLTEAKWRRYVTIEGEAELELLAQSRRPCVLATAYFGNPAVAAAVLGHIFRPIHVVADYLAQPQLRAWQRELYGLSQVRVIQRHEAGAMIPRVLENGGAVFLICEQERVRGPAVETEFLGRTLRCYPTLERLAQWYGATVVPVTCHRNDAPFSFTIQAEDAIVYSPDAGDVTRQTLSALECTVRRRPEQYLWSMPSVNANSDSITRRESESASCPRRNRRATGWQRPSAGDTRRGDSAAAAAPAPTA